MSPVTHTHTHISPDLPPWGAIPSYHEKMKYHLIAVASSCNRVQSGDQGYYSLGDKLAFEKGLSKAKKGKHKE